MPLEIDPGSADEIEPALRAYLSQQLGQAVAFAEPLEEMTGGRSTFVYAFRLEAVGGLDDGWARQLILRVHPLAEQTEQAEREAAVQNFMVDSGYPAPRVLAVETDLAHLGRPFIVMERLPGVTFLEHVGVNVGEAFRLGERMADLQADLHRLPTAGFPVPYERPAIDTILDNFQERIATYGLRHLQPAYKLLDKHRAIAIPEEPVICHNDFHPLNLIVDDDKNIRVIDWEGAALADRHCGVAWTMLILTVVLLPPESLLDRVLQAISTLIQPTFARRYLDRYQQHFELDPLRLCYWEAVQAFGLWLQFSLWRKAAGTIEGKPDNAQFWPQQSFLNLRNYLRERFQELHTLRQ